MSSKKRTTSKKHLHKRPTIEHATNFSSAATTVTNAAHVASSAATLSAAPHASQPHSTRMAAPVAADLHFSLEQQSIASLETALETIKELVAARAAAKLSVTRLTGVARELRELLKVMSIYI